MEKEDIIKIAGVAAVGIGALFLLRGGGKPQETSLNEIDILGWDVPTAISWVNPGGTITANVSWKNIGTRDIAPSFRLAIKKSGTNLWLYFASAGRLWTGYTFKEGDWLVAAKARPGETKVTQLAANVPGDWTSNKIEVRLDMLGVEGGVLIQKDAYETRVLAVSGLAVRYAKA